MYDERLDECILTESVPGSLGTTIEISLRRYKGGEPKIQITRLIRKDGDVIRTKLGRITLEEVSVLLSAVERIADKARVLLADSVDGRIVQPGLFEEA